MVAPDLDRTMAAGRFAGDYGQSLFLAGAAPGPILLLGLGRPEEFTPARLDLLGGRIAAELQFSGVKRATALLELDARLAAHLAFGLRLRAVVPSARHRHHLDEDERPSLGEMTIAVADPQAAEALFAKLEPVADAVLLARELVAEPGNHLTPEILSQRAMLLEHLGVEVEILDHRQLAAEGLGLLAAVGQGSVNPPRLALLRWQGGEEGQPPVALVGKGITFDSGGLSIKPADNMHKMKGDMGGAAAVLGAIRALAGRRAAVNAVGVLALAENMPGGNALRPGDVIRSYQGKTVEVIDTDAEGRLVLADAIAYACARFTPRAVVSIATLTGAIVTSLGRARAGMFANDDALAARLSAAGEAACEPVWRMPLCEAFDEDLASSIADIRNCAWGRVPDALHAARFLQGFVADGVPWGHLDIAGMSVAEQSSPLYPAGPTGFGVRLLELLVD